VIDPSGFVISSIPVTLAPLIVMRFGSERKISGIVEA
jgi:hypothetical protein